MNDVTRSMDATGAGAASITAERRRSRPSGWWGVALLICTEAALFGTMLASYFYLRFQVTEWPPPGIEPTPPARPLLLTGLLVATTVAASVPPSTGTIHWLPAGLHAASASDSPTTWWVVHASGAPSRPNHVRNDKRRLTVTDTAG